MVTRSVYSTKTQRSRKRHQTWAEALAKKQIQPVIDSRYKLEQIEEAQQYMQGSILAKSLLMWIDFLQEPVELNGPALLVQINHNVNVLLRTYQSSPSGVIVRKSKSSSL